MAGCSQAEKGTGRLPCLRRLNRSSSAAATTSPSMTSAAAGSWKTELTPRTRMPAPWVPCLNADGAAACPAHQGPNTGTSEFHSDCHVSVTVKWQGWGASQLEERVTREQRENRHDLGTRQPAGRAGRC